MGERLPNGRWHLFFWEQGFGSSASGHGDLVTARLSWSKGQAWGQAKPEKCLGTKSPSVLSQVGQVLGSPSLTSQRPGQRPPANFRGRLKTKEA